MSLKEHQIRALALDATTTQREWRGSEIHEEEKGKSKEAVEFPESFALTTCFLEGYKYPTLGAVLPLFTKLLMSLKKWNLDVGHSMESREATLAATEKLKNYYKGSHQFIQYQLYWTQD